MRRLLGIVAAALVLMPVSKAHSDNSGYATVGNLKMYYEIHGEGNPEPVIVLHGAYMDIPSMGEIIPQLAKERMVYAVELQGHGRTNDTNRPIRYQDLASDVSTFMDQMGLRKADVVGYSMGAAVGFFLATDHPDKVDQLVALSMAYDLSGMQPDYLKMIPQMRPEMFVGSPIETQWKTLSPHPGRFVLFVEKMIALEHEPVAWKERVRQLKSPTLLVTGDADVVTLEHSVELFRLLGGGAMGDLGRKLPKSRFAVLPASSHTAIIRQPDLLMDLIKPFLDGEHAKGMFEK